MVLQIIALYLVQHHLSSTPASEPISTVQQNDELDTHTLKPSDFSIPASNHQTRKINFKVTHNVLHEGTTTHSYKDTHPSDIQKSNSDTTHPNVNTAANIDKVTHPSGSTAANIDKVTHPSVNTAANIDKVTHPSDNTEANIDKVTHPSDSTAANIYKVTHQSDITTTNNDKVTYLIDITTVKDESSPLQIYSTLANNGLAIHPSEWPNITELRQTLLCVDFSLCSYNKEFKVPVCYCDSLCLLYGDCCIDFPHLNQNQFEQTGEHPEQSMVYYYHHKEVRSFQRYMSCSVWCYVRHLIGYQLVSSCPDGTKLEIVNLCVHNNLDIPLTMIPVVGANGIHFRNKFCAVCHNISVGKYWNLIIDGVLQTSDKRALVSCIYST